MTDAELVARARAGEADAFAELIRRHHARVLGLCASLLGGRDADDAAQESFLKAHRSLAAFHGDAAFSTWLHRIAANHCLDLLRRRARERTVPLEGLLESAAPREPDAAAALEGADLAERALERLSPEHRLILTLREAQGLDYAELCRVLDCTLDAVKGRLKRARRELEEVARHFSQAGDV